MREPKNAKEAMEELDHILFSTGQTDSGLKTSLVGWSREFLSNYKRGIFDVVVIHKLQPLPVVRFGGRCSSSNCETVIVPGGQGYMQPNGIRKLLYCVPCGMALERKRGLRPFFEELLENSPETDPEG